MKLLTLLAVFSLSSAAVAGDAPKLGSVDFHFDGGSLDCKFGTRDPAAKPVFAMIVYPTSVARLAEEGMFTPIPDVPGSTVVARNAAGKYVQLDAQAARAWAKDRATEMAVRKSSVAENAFLAAVLHTLYTGEPVRVWAGEGRKALEAGAWTKLFANRPRRSAPLPSEGVQDLEEDPFKMRTPSGQPPRR